MVVYRATPADVPSGVRVGDLEYPGSRLRRGVPAPTRRSRWRSSRCCTIRTSRRRSLSSRATRPATRRRRRSSTRCSRSRSQEPDRPRRPFLQRVVPGILAALAGAEVTPPPSDRMLADFLEDQRRAAPDERAADRGARGEDVAASAVERTVRAARQLPGRGELRRPPDVPLQGQGGRPAGAPRLRPRGDGARSRSSRRTPARCSTPPGWASTATA